jgi:hypothetical protein
VDFLLFCDWQFLRAKAKLFLFLTITEFLMKSLFPSTSFGKRTWRNEQAVVLQTHW